MPVTAENPRPFAKPAVGAEVLTLFRHSTHYFVGILCGMGLGFISFPIFTRMLTVADYGMIDLVQTGILLFVAIAKLGLQNSALRFYDGRRFAECHGDSRLYHSTMVMGAGGTGLFVMLAFAGGILALPGSWIEAPLRYVLCLAALLIPLRALASMLWTFLRNEGRTGAFNSWSVLMKACTVAVIILFFAFNGAGARSYFIGTIIVEAAIALGFIYARFRRGLVGWSFDPALFRTAVAFGMPLVLYEFSSIVLDSGDRVLVRHYLGADALGYYSVAYNISIYIRDYLTVPLNLAMVPLYIKIWSVEGPESTGQFLRRSFDYFAMVATALYACVLVTSRDVLTVFASTKYQTAAHLIPVLAAGLLIYTSNSFFSAGLMIHKQTITMAKAVLISTAFNIVLNCILLPRIGLQGAALATLLSYALCIALLSRRSAALLPLALELKRIPRYLLAAGASSLAAWRLEPGRPILNVLCRGAVALAVYVVVLLVVDQRSRDLLRSARRLPWRQRRI